MPSVGGEPSSGTEYTSGNDICGVCFTTIHPADNPRGQLNSCSHVFCAYCIREWAQSTNVCPHCKARFTRITSVDAAGNEVVTKVRKRNYRLWEEEEDDDGDGNNGDGGSNEVSASNFVVCNVCGQSDNAFRMILCDRRQCQYTVHLDCVHMVERPAEFFCPECALLRATPPPAEAEAAGGKNEEAQQQKNVSSVPQPVPPCPMHSKKILMPPPVCLRQTLDAGARRQSVLQQQHQIRVVAPAAPAPRSSQRREDTREAVAAVVNEGSEIDRAAQAAMQQFLKRQEERDHYVNLRRQRQADTLQCDAVLVQHDSRRWKRPRSSNTSSGADYAETEALLDPATRRREEDRLARRVAIELLPVLRRNQIIQENRLQFDSNGGILVGALSMESDDAQRDRELYTHAMTEARRIARERIDAKVANARLRKERLLAVQAQREAAALAKLAKIVAAHRVQSCHN
ncbi:PHD and RING finger domain-containing protein 1-like [Trypanosoma grayi]|uniref:PHD and RING finger domain-containing protein 1-like n=1 Tax=Trypanosoma grayi TaxID=71804 RepID=UPI0004F485BB|nr:PHD and RING finger domain-containing protein 1-like [Trypanosoma grayi]KEG08430.1 PHD and RING finger domain-containing protein 1-like [Trypanosoma grayi]